MAKTYKKKRTSKTAPKTKARRKTPVKTRKTSKKTSTAKYKVKVTAPVVIQSKTVTKPQAEDIKRQVKRREPKAKVTIVKA